MYDCFSYECPACGREFNTERAMEQHMDARNHRPVECQACGREFNTERALEQHMNAKNHRPFECDEDRQQHEHVDHHYCADCGREFQNFNNLRMHLNSSRHRGGSACPKCSKSFTTATGLAHHFETNACPNATTSRESIYRYVRSKDPNGLISKQLLEWDGPTKYEATGRTWNGDGYECYLCHREFNSLGSLNQHLNSPAHQQALYHCPNRNCHDFKTLAAIINHLESESCGITRFDAVQRGVSRMIERGRLIAF